jgi:hypothetical protein
MGLITLLPLRNSCLGQANARKLKRRQKRLRRRHLLATIGGRKPDVPVDWKTFATNQANITRKPVF